MPRAKKTVTTAKKPASVEKKAVPAVERLKRRAKAHGTTEKLVFTYEQDRQAFLAIEMALVRLRRIAATLRTATVGMERDQADTVHMASELVRGAQEAIAEALVMVQERQ